MQMCIYTCVLTETKECQVFSLSPSTLSPQDSLLLDQALAIFQLDRMKFLLVILQTAPSEQVYYS